MSEQRIIQIDWNGVDGNQHTAHFDDFINLQESICGFGDTQADAVRDLMNQWELQK